MGAAFQIRKGEKEFLGQEGGAFGVAELPEGDGLYGSPPGRLMIWLHLACRRRGVTGG